MAGALKLCSVVVRRCSVYGSAAGLCDKLRKAVCRVTSTERSHCMGETPKRPGQKQQDSKAGNYSCIRSWQNGPCNKCPGMMCSKSSCARQQVSESMPQMSATKQCCECHVVVCRCAMQVHTNSFHHKYTCTSVRSGVVPMRSDIARDRVVFTKW